MSFAVAMYFMLELEEGEAKKNNVKERLYRPQAKSNLNNPELEESLFYEKEPIKIEFECICRICQNAGEISIFDKSRNRDIANDIKSCANVEIENDDGLPSHICVECLDLLDIALLFKSKCEEMDAHLRVTLSEMKQEKIKKNNLHAQVKFLKTERSKIYKKDIRPNLKIIKPDEIKKLKYIENVNYDLLKPISAEEDNMPAEDNYGKIGQNVMHAVASYKKVESNRKPEYNTSVGGNYSEGQVSNVKEKYCHIIGDKLAKINQPVIVENNLHAQNKLAEIEEDTWNEKKLLTKAERMETQLAIIDRKDTFLQTKASKMQRAKIEEKKTMLRVRIEKLKQVRINNKRAYLQAKIEQEREKNDSLTQAKFGKKEQLSIEQQKFETTDQKIENDHTDNLAGVGVGGEKDTFEDDFFSDKEGVSQKPNHVSNSNKPDNRRNMTDGFVDCFKCYLCFYDRKEYKMHLATCQLDRRKLLCSYRRKIPEKLPWMCHICGKRFKHRPAFDDHRATHSYNLPFACDKCPYRGRTIEVLRIHSRVHTGYRPYKCTLCSKAFINSSNRNKHILVHDTNRPFKCQKCKKTFRTELIMNKHIHVVHDGANQVECDLCGVRLSSRSSIVKHKKIVHKIMPSQRSRRAIYLQVMAKEQGNDDSTTEETAQCHSPT